MRLAQGLRRAGPPAGRSRRTGALALLGVAALVLSPDALPAQERIGEARAWPGAPVADGGCREPKPWGMSTGGRQASPFRLPADAGVPTAPEPDGLLDGTLVGVAVGAAAGAGFATWIFYGPHDRAVIADPRVVYAVATVEGAAVGAVVGLFTDWVLR